MQNTPLQSGFSEEPHTADWALEVWASDLTGLLQQAARGMYALMQTKLAAEPRETYRFEINAPDRDMVLVTFLSELLYFSRRDEVGFDQFELTWEAPRLTATVVGAPIESLVREMNTVTHRNLAVRETERGLEATIVFEA
jgi:SHS2 domain-containing protein